MAESVKRRVAAARLAVAFAAAGTIVGTTAWATASPPPPMAEASARGQHIKKAVLQLRSEDIVDGSLLYKDFKKGAVASGRHIQKVVFNFDTFEKATLTDISTIKGEISGLKGGSADIKGEISAIKGEIADIEGESADYLKVTDDVVRGDGSVFTGSTVVGAQRVRLLEVPGMLTIDATWLSITITNTSGSPLTHSACTSRGQQVSGTLDPGESEDCDGRLAAQTLQLIGTSAGGRPQVATLNFSSLPINAIPEDRQVTVQILIGM